MNFDNAPLRKVDKIGKILGAYQFSKECNASLNPNQLHVLTKILATKLSFEEITQLEMALKSAE